MDGDDDDLGAGLIDSVVLPRKTTISSNEKIINSFAQKVQERDNRLGELQQLTEDNKKKLTDYEQERSKILDEANQLIEETTFSELYSEDLY